MALKKIIARETLVFFGFVILFGISWFIVHSYSRIHNKNVTEEKRFLYKELQSQKIEKSRIQQKINRIEEKREMFPQYALTTLERWQLHDSIELVWNTIWTEKIVKNYNRKGFSSPKELSLYLIENNSIILDSLSQKFKSSVNEMATTLIKVRKSQNSYFSMPEYKKMLKSIGLLIFIFLFVLRYCIYAIKWSVKTLRVEK